MESRGRFFKAKHPDLKKWIGRKLWIPIDEKLEEITIQKIGPVHENPALFEINEKYTIGCLRFFKQMYKADDISDEDCDEFEKNDGYEILPINKDSWKH